MTALWVEITSTRGSAPRDAGTAMKVTPSETEGTIGGGALEYKAIAKARDMLAKGRTHFTETLPLGPNLGQCCGGAVTLQYGDLARPTDPAISARMPALRLSRPVPLWLWGAGHVGRAVVAAAPPDGFEMTWVDDSPARFPTPVNPHVTILPTADMPRLAARAPRDAHHLIFTYSHDIDLALCAALIGRGFASCGLIGSATKWTRFEKRLRGLGLDPGAITCPIGDKSLGKAPHQIATGVIAALSAAQETKQSA